MTASIVLLCAAAVVLAHGSPVHHAGHEDGYPVNADRIDGLSKEQMGDMLSVRWCVTDPCELKKCKRMATEFNYMVSPRLHWSCVMEKSKEGCMEAIKNGRADVMMAEGDEIYKASKVYDLMPIMAEKFKGPHQNHYSIALVKISTDKINSFKDMSQKRSCHSGMDSMASFKTPMCSLIQEGIVPKVGNIFESAAEFFKESCVPGVLHANFNPNMTTPDSLCKLCQGPKDEFDFCMTLSEKEPYYGFTGALKCLRENRGDVGFFHTIDVMRNLHTLSQKFQLVCKKGREPLNWENIIKPDCHVAKEHPQVLMVSEGKSKEWINNCTKALEDASSKLSSSGNDSRFSLFDSSPYCAKKVTEADTSEETRSNVRNWIKNSHLIFKDYSNALETIAEDKRSLRGFLNDRTTDIWKSCAQLEPKPRAFICVVGNEEMQKCKATIDTFQDIQEVRRRFSWGCVKVSSKKECMDLIDSNTADIVDLNAIDMFLAGNDYNLAPFIGRNYKGKNPWTKSITVGVIRKELRRNLTRDTSGWKLCGGSIQNINGFLHPIGWLLANGTIKRSTTLLKSIVDHFGKSCVPGMKSLDLLKHPLLSRTLDWDSLLEKISWEGWYETPIWMKWWQTKQTGVVNDYQCLHDIYNFESPQFRRIMEIVMSAEPETITNAQLAQKIQGLQEKMRHEFHWDKYDGLQDFYGDKQKFSWDMTSWLWEKPVDLTKLEWQLFMSWAEKVWDQKEDWENYMKKWSENALDVFKKWIDEDYEEFLSHHKPLHKDVFIRFTLLSDRYHWLLQQWKKLQWSNKDIKSFREKLCDACVGQGKNKCALNDSEPYYGNLGSLRCLKQRQGDVAFMDWYAFEDALPRTALKKEDFLLLCPDGNHVQASKIGAVQECNFGKVPASALATCNMHDQEWRKKFAEALHQVKERSPLKFKDSIFGAKTEDLSRIPFANQTYPVWLGSKFLDAMEGILQPTGEEQAMHEELHPTTLTKFLIEKRYLDDPFDLPSCDECEIKDINCKKNCWASGPSVSGKTESKKGRKPVIYKIGKFGGHRMIPQVLPKKSLLGMMMKKPNKPEIKLWKPEGVKIHSVVHDCACRHSMAHEGHHEMRSPIMGVKDAGKHRMEIPGMMDHDKFTSPMMHGMRPTKNWMETGPIMRSPKTLRSEFYSKVIFAKNGTCNTIVRELRCFGEKRNIRMWVGRVSKTLITVPMCPLPTDMKKTTAQFTCNTGVGFIRPIYLPVRCSYAPCKSGFSNADRTMKEDSGQDYHLNRFPSNTHDASHT